MKKSTYTVQQFNKDYPDNGACLNSLFMSRFGSLPCPSCGRVGRYYRQEDTAHYVCQCGGHQVSPKSGTIFEKSDTDLYKWFYAIFLFSTAKNGVSAKELERQLGVTYKTAWRIGHQIRSLMAQDKAMLGGVVEADETYVGGKEKNKHADKRTKGTHGRSTKTKVPVFGLSERGGGVFAKVVPNAKASTVTPLIKANVRIGTKIMTDDLASYNRLVEGGYSHEVVSHSSGEYVRGDAHTNGMEGFWGQMKRSIDGTHHNVSPKHLQKYADQHVWLWDRRDSATPLFSELAREASASRR